MIRRLFILYIGLRTIRTSLTLELDTLSKLIYLSDEIALMFFVPIVVQILQRYNHNKLHKEQNNLKLIIRFQIIISVIFYCALSLINGYLNLFILLAGYLGASLCYFILKIAKLKVFYLRQGPTFFGFFIYILCLVIVSDHLKLETAENIFLLIILPRVAYSNIFSLVRKKV